MGPAFKDYYKILGVSRTASGDDIRQAFRRLARKFHPDVARNKAEAEERFKEINEAYEVLGDPAKRKTYDELGPDWKHGRKFTPPKGGFRRGSGDINQEFGAQGEQFEFHGTGFSDFFEQLFGSARRGQGGFGGSMPGARGQDIEGELMVSLEEVLHGSIRAITVSRQTHCDRCGGEGEVHGGVCPRCRGAGVVEQDNTHKVKIPIGIRDGQRLRLAGYGGEGHQGRAGDLYLRVRLAAHPEFLVDNGVLTHELDLAPWEAVLGTHVAIPVLGEGQVEIKVPPGTQNGQRLRVRHQGLPEGHAERGDLIVTVRVRLPAQVSDAERAQWDALARISKFHPRDGAC